MGADQRAVLRLLVARSGVRVRCDRPRARVAAKRRSTCATCRSCGWSRRRSPTRAGGGSLSAGWRSSSACGRWMRCCRRSGGTQPAVLRHRCDQAARSAGTACAAPRKWPARSPQRRARPVQPQARPGAGQPVAVRAACRRQAASACSAGAIAAALVGMVDPARRLARVVDHLRAGAAVVGLAPARLEAAAGRVRVRRGGAGGAGAGVAAGARAAGAHHARVHRDEHGVDNALSGRARIWGAATVHGAHASGQWRRRARLPRVVRRLRSGPGRDRGVGRGPGAACAPDRAGSAQRNRRLRPAAVAGRRRAGVARLAFRRRRRHANARARRCWRWR